MDNTCKARVADAFASRMADLRQLWQAGYGVEVADLGCLEDYGLAIDKVEADSLGNHPGYWRYQISWGGPAEEFRYYDQNGGRVEFWLLDWWDGAALPLTGRDAAMIKNIIDPVRLSLAGHHRE